MGHHWLPIVVRRDLITVADLHFFPSSHPSSWPTMLLVSCLIILLHLQNALSQIIPPNERCVTAVYTAYEYLSFSGQPNKGLWAPRCRNRLHVLSIYAASDLYCSDAEREAGFAQLDDQCRQYAGVDLIPRQEFAPNLTHEAISQMRVVEFGELPKKGPLDTPILISKSYYSRVFRTIVRKPGGLMQYHMLTKTGCVAI